MHYTMVCEHTLHVVCIAHRFDLACMHTQGVLEIWCALYTILFTVQGCVYIKYYRIVYNYT